MSRGLTRSLILRRKRRRDGSERPAGESGAGRRRVSAAALVALSVAACSGGAAPPSGPPAGAGPAEAGPPTPTAQLRVRFGGIADTIEVRAVEVLPLRAAALIAPDGTATPASYIAVDPNPRIATGQWGLSHRWDESVARDGALAALALGNAQAGAALYSRQQLLAVASTADIPLPDPVAYRRDWQNYRVRLTFGTPPGEVETLAVAAPAPPPPAPPGSEPRRR